jgi:hypothetical protein
MTRRQFAPALCGISGQVRGQPPDPDKDIRYPDGRSRTEELLKDDYKKNLQDLEEIGKLAEDVRADLEKNTRHVLSIANLKKMEQIEKLSQRVRGRMRRY